VLVTHFDASPESVVNSVVPDSASDLGDRLILAPQELNPDIDHTQIMHIALAIGSNHNVVVIVPSRRKAESWNSHAAAIVSTSDQITEVVARLQAGHVGIVVIVNRYEGIDLPDEACRLLVIDELPLAFSGLERREALALRDSEAMVGRQLQRLEQGMGRGVRSRDDRCAIVLYGSKLVQLISRMDASDKLSDATRAQLKLSRNVSRQLNGASVEAIVQVIEQVIEGDDDFRRASREALIGVTYSPAKVEDYMVALRGAYNGAIRSDHAEAAKLAEIAVNLADSKGDSLLSGWLAETWATYIQPFNPLLAQGILAEAGTKNRAVLKPIQGVRYQRIESNGRQAVQSSEHLTRLHDHSRDLVLSVDAVLDAIVWDNERTDETESAIADLGRILGFIGQRPEHEFKIGSDVFWAMGDGMYAVIEAKTGSRANLIIKKDINQLAGSVNWSREVYGQTANITPVLVHPSPKVEATGTPPLGTRVIRHEEIRRLKTAVKTFTRSLAFHDGFREIEQVQAQLAHHRLLAQEIFDAYSVVASRSSERADSPDL
jgi:hypothetical protein